MISEDNNDGKHNNKYDSNYEQIANLFIDSLLKMSHVSSCVKLDNSFHELLLFTHKQSAVLLSSPNNEYYMKNERKQFRHFLPEVTSFYCDVYLHKGRKLETIKFDCDNKWYKFLKNVLKSERYDDGKYSCNIQCPELFELIVSKLEALGYNFEEYIQMENEYKQIEEKINELPIKRKEIEDELKILREAIDKTDSVIHGDHDKNLEKIAELTKKLIEIKDVGIRHVELKQTVVSANIRKVRNIRTFVNAVKKTDAYAKIMDTKAVIPSAPAYYLSLDHNIKNNFPVSTTITTTATTTATAKVINVNLTDNAISNDNLINALPNAPSASINIV